MKMSSFAPRLALRKRLKVIGNGMFSKSSGRSVKRQSEACERMGLVTNGTRSSQTAIPKRNFPNFFVNGKRTK